VPFRHRPITHHREMAGLHALEPCQFVRPGKRIGIHALGTKLGGQVQKKICNNLFHFGGPLASGAATANRFHFH